MSFCDITKNRYFKTAGFCILISIKSEERRGGKDGLRIGECGWLAVQYITVNWCV